jgi:hypothetical protein|tara:strand:+ start:1317 stop:3758 length:2442 start_codon:yes stop_codon:yes gene_type:complete
MRHAATLNKHEVTIFKNIKETQTPFFKGVYYILERIKDGSSKDLVKQIRNESDKLKRNELKKNLPAICFSGKFNKRSDSSILEHSGLICLDYDGYAKQKDLLQDKERFIKNKFVYSVFVSPSGNGLKVLIRIPREADNHTKYFNSLEKELGSEYFDTTSKNISRVCYESYDPLIHINDTSLEWSKIEEEEYKEMSIKKDPITIQITDENKIVDILTKWWTKKYPMTEGHRNQHTYILAMAFNDFGINKSLASFICNQFQSSEFPLSEITTTINSAYLNTANFGTKFYEDKDAIDEIAQRLRRGDSKVDIRKSLEDSMVETEVINSVLEKADEDVSIKFWSKSEKGTVKVIPVVFKKFLEDNGFYKYCPEGSSNYVFVKVTNNLIDHTTDKDIKDYILNHLYTMQDTSIYNYFADQTRLFREEFLTLLSTIDIYFISDTKNTSYLYYKNCAVSITKDAVTPIDYLDLGGYVWKDHVIDRMYKPIDVFDCDYKTFIHNISGKKHPRTLTMESTIGFLMHGHKNLSYCPAVILNDEVISENPEGGTGKGIFMNALSKMKKLVKIDGKAFTFDRSFAYQLVSADTQILSFDDVKKHFDFERLFSVVTEGITLEKKNKDAITIPFSKSPKIAITTNYAIRGTGNSFTRRKWELELHQHYNKDYTPQDEFGKLMFGDWDDTDWCKFDNYMIKCLQLYLSKGLLKSEFVNLNVRQLGQATSHEFLEWCGILKGTERNIRLIPHIKIYKQELYYDFIDENPDYAPRGAKSKSFTRTGFYRWLVMFANYKFEATPKEGRDNIGRWIHFLTKHDKEEQQSINF